MKRTLAAGFALVVAVTVACGDDDLPGSAEADDAAASSNPVSGASTTSDPAPDRSASASPATSGAASGDRSDTPGVPERIVSMSATHTEILFAIGAGDQVVAVDEQSDYPEQVKELQAGLSAYEPSVEAIASQEPDLVVLSDDGGLSDQLGRLGIESWVGPAAVTFDDLYTQIEQLGAATGHVAEAAELVGQMQSDLEQLTKDVPRPKQPLTVYHELDPNLFSASSKSFIGAVYEMFGLVNIADEAKGGGAYPQLNAEYVVESDPDLIFLADAECCNQNAETLAERDGWADLSAIRNGLVFETPDDVASRWGPRIVDYARTVRNAVVKATELDRVG